MWRLTFAFVLGGILAAAGCGGPTGGVVAPKNPASPLDKKAPPPKGERFGPD